MIQVNKFKWVRNELTKVTKLEYLVFSTSGQIVMTFDDDIDCAIEFVGCSILRGVHLNVVHQTTTHQVIGVKAATL